MRNSSQNAGCMRRWLRSPTGASHCCQVRHVVCTSTPAAVWDSPTASRAARTCSGVGLDEGPSGPRLGWLGIWCSPYKRRPLSFRHRRLNSFPDHGAQVMRVLLLPLQPWPYFDRLIESPCDTEEGYAVFRVRDDDPLAGVVPQIDGCRHGMTSTLPLADRCCDMRWLGGFKRQGIKPCQVCTYTQDHGRPRLSSHGRTKSHIDQVVLVRQLRLAEMWISRVAVFHDDAVKNIRLREIASTHRKDENVENIFHSLERNGRGGGHFLLQPLWPRGAVGKQCASHELNYTRNARKRNNFLQLFFGGRGHLAKPSNAKGQEPCAASCARSPAPTGCASNGNYNERTDK